MAQAYCAVCGAAVDQWGHHIDELTDEDHMALPQPMSFVESQAVRRAFVLKQRAKR